MYYHSRITFIGNTVTAIATDFMCVNFSGVVGSGICILSKYLLQDVFFHQWPVNGYVHKLQHGDWFGGKGVGLARLKINDYHINIYTAHVCIFLNYTFQKANLIFLVAC